MKLSDVDGTESPSSAAAPGASAEDAIPKPEPGATGAAANDGLIESLVRCFGEVFAAAESLVEVQADRARHSLRGALVKALVGAGLAVSAIVWLGTAAFAAVRGACGGLTELFGGRVWLGELSGGVLALAFVAGAFAAHNWWSARRELERLKSKYERMRHEREPQPRPELSTEVGG